MVELTLAEMLEEQRNYKYVFPAAVQENEEKVVDMAKQELQLAPPNLRTTRRIAKRSPAWRA